MTATVRSSRAGALSFPKQSGTGAVAVPGTLWPTAYLGPGPGSAPGAETRVVPFEIGSSKEGSTRAGRMGLIIHEGQLTYGGHGLHKVVDLGAVVKAETGLPLPLGANAVRRRTAWTSWPA